MHKHPRPDDQGRQEIDELLLSSRALPRGARRVAIVEEAVNRADLLNDLELSYECRQELIEAACFGGRSDLMLVHFAWCLGQFDRDPERFDEHALLWRYKWVTSHAKDFASIPLPRIEGLLSDMARRYEDYGASPRPVLAERRSLAMHRRLSNEARTLTAEYESARRDELSDCRACEKSDDVDYDLFVQIPDEQVVERFRPVLDGTIRRCATVPGGTYGKLLLPLLRLGRDAEAAQSHRQGMRYWKDNPDAMSGPGRHIVFLALTGNLDRGARLIGSRWEASPAPTDGELFSFLRSVRLWVMAAEQSGETSWPLRFPETVPVRRSASGIPLAPLAAHLDEQLDALAERFDARNATLGFRQRLAELPDLLRQARTLPIGS